MAEPSIPESVDAYEPDDPKGPLWLNRLQLLVVEQATAPHKIATPSATKAPENPWVQGVVATPLGFRW
ncbi:hypothetical protein [Kitasatospora sp. NPDC092286]|uniref:hypothetical protein n=1 Tax=Kitasatospora sp. NPDC092286 TaxID=3364087 RepID=UPI00380AA423